jgi:hypothetical protein
MGLENLPLKILPNKNGGKGGFKTTKSQNPSPLPSLFIHIPIEKYVS